ncbi:FMN-binding negative transcriptional regulator, partial [Bradyrhizobium sp. 30]|nr:FMN-binding negative transcriptional regulator [Bradyrhizobium sp. 30]MCK1296411.1 FMN-binding negative transcriptional regulator [Bradyrhizobium sp. 30]
VGAGNALKAQGNMIGDAMLAVAAVKAEQAS